MTLHDRLKEIIDRHNYNLCMLPGSPDQETISAIIQAVAEQLPGERDEPKIIHDWDFGHEAGWNTYREEVVKALEEK